ncbi:TMEM175 family protein [Haliscomenobacter sp.]|uniref:TMEM175 family protein n=1 Tax=Haliscomenobacter sp. TaxID=2717303 RepID=UPI003BA9FAEE
MLSKNRIEAFSDGVIAIIITIMAFDLKIPELAKDFSDQDVWKALEAVVPKILSYMLSFVVVAIMWLNHHAMFDRIAHSTSKLVWYNMFLLFAMSLIPMPTNFLALHPFLPQAVMFYGFILFLNAFGFFLLRRYEEVDAQLLPYNAVVQRSNLVSTLLYLASIPLAFVSVYLSFLIFVGIPLWYFLPDRFRK